MTEALYVAKFGDVAAPDVYRNAGVAVLETGRIFGGDSGFHYIGTYQVEGTAVRGTATITRHDPNWISAFGEYSGPFRIKFSGQMRGKDIDGFMEHDGTGKKRLPLKLIWLEPLP